MTHPLMAHHADSVRGTVTNCLGAPNTSLERTPRSGANGRKTCYSVR
jgi:hypothetical protein